MPEGPLVTDKKESRQRIQPKLLSRTKGGFEKKEKKRLHSRVYEEWYFLHILDRRRLHGPDCAKNGTCRKLLGDSPNGGKRERGGKKRKKFELANKKEHATRFPAHCNLRKKTESTTRQKAGETKRGAVTIQK